MRQYIGQTFKVKGFNEARTVKIEDVYLLGGQKRYPAFKCIIQGEYKHFKDGEQENILCKDVVRNGSLLQEIKVLTA